MLHCLKVNLYDSANLNIFNSQPPHFPSEWIWIWLFLINKLKVFGVILVGVVAVTSGNRPPHPSYYKPAAPVEPDYDETVQNYEFKYGVNG